jgi:hypothetical protein
MSEERTLEFASSGMPIGAEPDLAAAIVWHVVKEAGVRKWQVVELAIRRRVLRVTIRVPSAVGIGEPEDRRDVYIRAVGEQIREAIGRASQELAAKGHVQGGMG